MKRLTWRSWTLIALILIVVVSAILLFGNRKVEYFYANHDGYVSDQHFVFYMNPIRPGFWWIMFEHSRFTKPWEGKIWCYEDYQSQSWMRGSFFFFYTPWATSDISPEDCFAKLCNSLTCFRKGE